MQFLLYKDMLWLGMILCDLCNGEYLVVTVVKTSYD